MFLKLVSQDVIWELTQSGNFTFLEIYPWLFQVAWLAIYEILM